MRYCIGILAIFCLLVTAVGAASECGACVFSAASSWNECPPCIFGNDTDEDRCPPCVFGYNTTRSGCPACVFSKPASLNGCSVCEFSIHVEGDGHATTQISGGQIRVTVVYRSPHAYPVVPEGFSRGYMGYDPAHLPSGSPSQNTFDKPAGLFGYPGTQPGFERFAGILPASSGFSRFMR